MIVLDTNVLSEFMKNAPSLSVRRWLNEQEAGRLFVSSISVAEISAGIETLPEGRRRRDLAHRFQWTLGSGYESRILPFDEDAAWEYGRILAARKASGRPIAALDGQIAAIARSRGFALATRNVRDFEHCGLTVIDPFAEG